MLAVDRDTLGRLTLLTGLLTVPGLNRTTAAVLYNAEITDAATLAAARPKDLLRSYAAAAKKRKDDHGSVRPVEVAQAWIDAAAQLANPAAPAAGA